MSDVPPNMDIISSENYVGKSDVPPNRLLLDGNSTTQKKGRIKKKNY